MQVEPKRRPIERNRSDHIKDKACNGCRYLTVLDRKRTSVMDGRKHVEWYEEYYCNADGRVLDPPDECKRRR